MGVEVVLNDFNLCHGIEIMLIAVEVVKYALCVDKCIACPLGWYRPVRTYGALRYGLFSGVGGALGLSGANLDGAARKSS